MSPASSGALEIERYIGACLISSTHHQNHHRHTKKKQQQHHSHQNGLHRYHLQHQHHNTNLNAAQHHVHQFGNYHPQQQAQPVRGHYVPDIFHLQHQSQYPPNVHERHRQLAVAAAQQAAAAAAVSNWSPAGSTMHGGVPLINFKQRPTVVTAVSGNESGGARSNTVPDGPNGLVSASPLTRLAVHTQGAPLILTNSRYHNYNRDGKFAARYQQHQPLKPPVIVSATKCVAVDAASVASDESSGSAHSSETCLPRIIKPRKRRKKDRKHITVPSPQSPSDLYSLSPSSSLSTSSSCSSSSSSVTTSPDIILHNRHLPPSFAVACESLILGSGANDKGGDMSETPQLHHAFEDVVEAPPVDLDINGNVASTCQCRYCDPRGQIWDIDRSCYSPYLTTTNTTTTIGSVLLNDIFHFPHHILPPRSSSVVMSDAAVTNKTFVGVIGGDSHHYHHHHHHPQDNEDDKFLANCISRVSLDDNVVDDEVFDADSEEVTAMSDLQVSTEIVTSLNGHRDLEIKFFTSSASAGRR